jgi:hypothetical protein
MRTSPRNKLFWVDSAYFRSISIPITYDPNFPNWSVGIPLIPCLWAPNPLGQLRSTAEALLRGWLYIDLTRGLHGMHVKLLLSKTFKHCATYPPRRYWFRYVRHLWLYLFPPVVVAPLCGLRIPNQASPPLAGRHVHPMCICHAIDTT